MSATTCTKTSDFHTAHLTKLAQISLKMPGTWAWALVLRLRLATRNCDAWRA
jgi:hypothetical protein